MLGWGLSYDAFHDAPISAEAIADATGDAPAFLTFFDYHSGLASRPALALAGVDGPRAFGAGAAVVCDDGGRPTGELREAPAMELVRARVPERTRAERLDAYAASLRAMNALGLTGGHVMLGWPWLLDELDDARGARRPDAALRRAAAVRARRHRRRGRGAARAPRPRAAGAGAAARRSSSSTA